MIRELDTKRLILRPLQLSDAARTQQLFGQWEIVQYLNAVVPWPYPEDGALRYIRDVALPAVDRGDEWHWTLRLREAPSEQIGAIGLFRSASDNRGFWIGKKWQGRGLMSEAVVAATEYWFNVLGFACLRTSKARANIASRRISERTGMRLVATGEREYVSGRASSEVWEQTLEEWQRYRATRPETNLGTPQNTSGR